MLDVRCYYFDDIFFFAVSIAVDKIFLIDMQSSLIELNSTSLIYDVSANSVSQYIVSLVSFNEIDSLWTKSLVDSAAMASL